MHTRHRQSGFVLVLVLVVLAATAVFLAAAARRSADLAARAALARAELQRKWAFVSCQGFFMGQAEDLFNQPGQPDNLHLRRAIVLGGTELVAVLGDEQAKANVNLLAAQYAEGAEAHAANLRTGGRRTLRILLRPGQAPPGAISSFPLLYRSYAQVFAYEHPSELLDVDSGETAAGQLTCWGSGKVNSRKAPPTVLRAAAAGLLTEGQLDKLQKLLAENPFCMLDEALKKLDVPKERQEALRRVLTDRSQCHTLWLVARAAGRDYYRLYVRSEADSQTNAQNLVFAW